MSTRDKLAADFAAPKTETAEMAQNAAPTAPRVHTHTPANSRLKQEHRGFLGINLDTTQETQETQELNKFNATTQAALTESYKAQKSNFSAANAEQMTQSPWKKAFWAAVVDDIDGLVSAGVFYTLRDSAWLDQVEGDVVFVATGSEYWAAQLAREAAKPLTQVISHLLGKKMRLRFIKGKVRVIELGRPQATQSASDHQADGSVEGEEAELLMLHEKFGDIMGIVDNHPLFKSIQLPIKKGGWGIFPQVLTVKCKEYGVLTVLKAIRFVINRPSVMNPRAFFLHALNKGQFGYRLARSAPDLGPRRKQA